MGKLFCGVCYQVFFDWRLLMDHLEEHLKNGENANLKEGVEVLKKVTANEGPISLN